MTIPGSALKAKPGVFFTLLEILCHDNVAVKTADIMYHYVPYPHRRFETAFVYLRHNSKNIFFRDRFCQTDAAQRQLRPVDAHGGAYCAPRVYKLLTDVFLPSFAAVAGD